MLTTQDIGCEGVRKRFLDVLESRRPVVRPESRRTLTVPLRYRSDRSWIGGTEAAVMKQKPRSRNRRKRSSNKSVLHLPDLEHDKAAVLNSLLRGTSDKGCHVCTTAGYL